MVSVCVTLSLRELPGDFHDTLQWLQTAGDVPVSVSCLSLLQVKKPVLAPAVSRCLSGPSLLRCPEVPAQLGTPPGAWALPRDTGEAGGSRRMSLPRPVCFLFLGALTQRGSAPWQLQLLLFLVFSTCLEMTTITGPVRASEPPPPTPAHPHQGYDRGMTTQP